MKYQSCTQQHNTMTHTREGTTDLQFGGGNLCNSCRTGGDRLSRWQHCGRLIYGLDHGRLLLGTKRSWPHLLLLPIERVIVFQSGLVCGGTLCDTLYARVCKRVTHIWFTYQCSTSISQKIRLKKEERKKGLNYDYFLVVTSLAAQHNAIVCWCCVGGYSYYGQRKEPMTWTKWARKPTEWVIFKL